MIQNGNLTTQEAVTAKGWTSQNKIHLLFFKSLLKLIFWKLIFTGIFHHIFPKTIVHHVNPTKKNTVIEILMHIYMCVCVYIHGI